MKEKTAQDRTQLTENAHTNTQVNEQTHFLHTINWFNVKSFIFSLAIAFEVADREKKAGIIPPTVQIVMTEK